MNNDEIDRLIDKYLAGECTDEERALVEQAYLSSYDPLAVRNNADHLAQQRKAVWHKLQVQRRGRSRLRKLLPYAAAVLITATAATWIFLSDQIGDRPATTVHAQDISPGTNRATLTLADGRIIDLNEGQEGIVIGDDVTYLDGTEVLREGLTTADPRLATDLQLTTPRGGQYQVTLPDGSKVWLNANSTLKYPSRFSDDERVVELTGEGYFEINRLKSASSAFQPFKVITNGQTVEVLGTQFNISAYADEQEIKTTLVEGSVRLRAAATGASVSLVPGEQGRLSNGAITKADVDTEPYIAWKDGVFSFHGTDLHSLMRQLARWYDVEVAYEGELNYKPFFGSIERSYNLSEVLEVLKLGNVNFKLEQSAEKGGRPRLVVLPKTD